MRTAHIALPTLPSPHKGENVCADQVQLEIRPIIGRFQSASLTKDKPRRLANLVRSRLTGPRPRQKGCRDGQRAGLLLQLWP